MQSINLIVLTIALIGLFEESQSSPTSENVTKVLNELMKKSYDKRVRPLLGDNALFVRVSFNLDGIININEPFQEITVRLTLRQSWLEPRLTFSQGAVLNDTIQLVPEHSKLLWLPDTIIGNQRSFEKLEGHEFTLLNNEGLITTSSKILVSVDCKMDYGNFPFDTQVCSFNFLSHNHDRRDIIYEWINEESIVDGNNQLAVGRFKFISYDTQTLNIKTKQGTLITTLVLRLHFQALWKEYLSTLYLPLIFLTIVSLGSLWILDTNIQSVILILNIAFMSLFLVMLRNDKNIHIQDTPISQFLKSSLFFVFASIIVVSIKAYLSKNPVKKSESEEKEEDEKADEIEIKDVELGESDDAIELEEKASSTGRKSSNSDSEQPATTEPINKNSIAPKIIDYYYKIRLGLERFCGHAYWILTITFIIFNFFYFGAHINDQESRVQHVIKNIHYS